jgi:DNA-binding SARP family transcriptional activator
MHYFAGEAAPVLAHARRGLALWDAVDAARAADPAVDAELAPAAGRGRSITHQMTGLAHAMLGDGDAAVRAMNASVDAAAAAGEAWLHAVMTMRRGLVHLIVGRGDAAMADYVASVPLLRAAGETWFLSLAVEGMAAVELVRGDLAAAAAHARESIAVLADEPDAWFVSRSLDMLAAIATRAGAPPGPAPTPERAAAAARLLGAAAELRARCGAEVIGHDRERHAAAIATARALLGEAAFAATWAEGEELDLAGAAALAAAADVADPPAAAADAAPPGRAAVPAADGSTLGTQWLGTPAPAAGGGPPALQVLALGPPAVARDGAPLGAGELPAGKATELLLYLVLHPEGRTKEQIGLALWPDASAGQLRGNFHVMLHHVRRALAGPERDAARPWIAYADGRYRLAREAAPGAALDCDVDAVLDAAARLGAAERRGEALDAGALAALGAALARRRGPLGEGLALGAWAAPVAARVGAAWGDAVQALARQHARAGRPAAGAEALAGLVAAEPLREGAHRELMVLWAAAGERARALAHYDELCALLARELGAGPARDTRLVAEAIRRQG